MVDQRSATYAAQVNTGQYDGVNPVNMRDGVKIYEERIAVTALAANDYIEFVKLPSGSRIHSIKMAYDNMGTTLTFDLGVATAPDADDTVVVGDILDIDILADAILLQTTVIIPTEVLGFGNVAPELIGLPLWDIATALTVDPEVDYLIVGQCITSGTPLAGDVYIRIEYTTTLGAA